MPEASPSSLSYPNYPRLRSLQLATLAVALAVAGCTTTETITDGVCGNGVLDPGEDCDNPETSLCTATCRLVCSVADRGSACTGAPDGACCPLGSTCGLDDTCHTPTGRVAATVQVPYDTSAFLVSDINGDGIADVFGLEASAVVALYGDATSPLSRSASTPSPTHSGETSFGDFNNDGRFDMLEPTAAGLFLYETTTGVPAPVPFPVSSTLGVVHQQIAPTPDGSAVFVLDTTLDFTGSNTGSGDIVELSEYDTTFTTQLVAPFPACGTATKQVTIGRNLHPIADGARTLVPVVTNETACVLPFTGASLGSAQTLSKLFAGTGHINETVLGDVFFARVLGQNPQCPDLVLPAFVDGGNKSLIVGASPGAVAGACSVTPGTLGSEIGSNEALIPGLPLGALQVQVGAASVPAVITGQGVWAGSDQQLLFGNTRVWHGVAVADLDHNGLDDFVTIGAGADLEVFLQVPGSGSTASFEILPIPTDGTVLSIAVGDYDGDGHGDVAFITVDDGGAGDLQIAWGGTPGGFVVTDFGTISEPSALTEIALTDDSLPQGFDHTDDLVVAHGGSDDPTNSDAAELVAVFGTPDRALSAPYIYRNAFGGSAATIRASGEATQFGAFGTTGSAGALAIFEPSPFYAGVVPDTSLRELVALGSDGDTFAIAGQTSVDVGDCGGTTDGPCLDTAHLQRASFAGQPDIMFVLRANGDKDTGSGGDDECMDWVQAGAPPTLTKLACQTTPPPDLQFQPSPYYAAPFDGFVSVNFSRLVDNVDGATPRVLLTFDPSVALATGFRTFPNGDIGTTGSNGSDTGVCAADTAGNAAYVWTVQMVGGTPQFVDPINFDTEVGGAAGTIARCGDAFGMELGSRDVDGITYGASSREIVTVCLVGSSCGATPPTTQVWARFAADPNQANPPPHYEEIVDLGPNTSAKVRTGDINGDGLDDLLLAVSATKGATSLVLEAFEQCDSHDSRCSSGSGGAP